MRQPTLLEAAKLIALIEDMKIDIAHGYQSLVQGKALKLLDHRDTLQSLCLHTTARDALRFATELRLHQSLITDKSVHAAMNEPIAAACMALANALYKHELRPDGPSSLDDGEAAE